MSVLDVYFFLFCHILGKWVLTYNCSYIRIRVRIKRGKEDVSKRFQ